MEGTKTYYVESPAGRNVGLITLEAWLADELVTLIAEDQPDLRLAYSYVGGDEPRIRSFLLLVEPVLRVCKFCGTSKSSEWNYCCRTHVKPEEFVCTECRKLCNA